MTLEEKFSNEEQSSKEVQLEVGQRFYLGTHSFTNKSTQGTSYKDVYGFYIGNDDKGSSYFIAKNEEDLFEFISEYPLNINELVSVNDDLIKGVDCKRKIEIDHPLQKEYLLQRIDLYKKKYDGNLS